MKNMAKRDAVSVYMESPIYFSLPVQQRLDLVNRKPAAGDTRSDFLAWVKTGYFNLSRLLGTR
jgi:hypothetical protein